MIRFTLRVVIPIQVIKYIYGCINNVNGCKIKPYNAWHFCNYDIKMNNIYWDMQILTGDGFCVKRLQPRTPWSCKTGDIKIEFCDHVFVSLNFEYLYWVLIQLCVMRHKDGLNCGHRWLLSYFLPQMMMMMMMMMMMIIITIKNVDAKVIWIIQGLSKRFEHLLLWPPKSPDLTPCDVFLWGTLKTMPTNHKLQDRIRAAVQTIEGEQVS